jgi:phosphoribosylglycinamide formyltransferase 1
VNPRIGVLASGAGSNLEAILNYFVGAGEGQVSNEAGTEHGAVALVASDNPGAGALERGASRGIDSIVLRQWADGPALVRLLEEHRIDAVALAGYVRRVPADVTNAFRGRMLNIHPSLLPAFGGTGMYGRRVHEAVIAAGVRVSGATVHFVDAEYDHGPIVAQVPVPVFPSDDAATLAARVLRVEHALYPRAIDAVVTRRVTLRADGRVTGTV